MNLKKCATAGTDPREAGELKGKAKIEFRFGLGGTLEVAQGEEVFWEGFSEPVEEFKLYTF